MADDRPLDVLVVENERGASVVVTGELDIASRDVLASRLDNAMERFPHVQVDLSGVTFIDSTGLHALLAASQTDSASFEIVSTSETVRRLLLLTGLEDVLAPGLTSSI